VIESFRHKGLRTFFEDDDRRKIPAAQGDKIARILARLEEEKGTGYFSTPLIAV